MPVVNNGVGSFPPIGNIVRRMAGSVGGRAVVFDFGGVLITPITNQIGEVAADHDVPIAVMVEILLGPLTSGQHPWHRAERGELAVAEIQGLLQPWADRHGVGLRGDELATILRGDGYAMVEVMTAKVAQLKRSGVTTALLTNTFAEFRPTMERDLCFDDFDHIVESFAVGARKPEPAIYEATRAMLGVDHRDIVYLDDFIHNIEAARDLGWTTIHVTDPHSAIELIDELL